MTATQTAVTVMADILPGHEDALRQQLERAGQDPANNPLVPFGGFANVHFARFFIMVATRDLVGRPLSARLVFLADLRRAIEEFLDRAPDQWRGAAPASAST